MYTPTLSPLGGDPALRAYLEREFHAIARSMADRGAQVNAIDDYGAKGDGSADDYGAIQAMIDDGYGYLPGDHTYLIGSKLAIADGSPLRLYGDGPTSIIRKGFDGDMLSLGLRSEIDNLWLDGNGANFTGRGIIIETGAGGNGWQNLHDLRIFDTESYNVEYTTSGAGLASRIVNCWLGVYNRPTTAAVRYPDVDVNGPRILSECVTLGVLAELGAAHGIQMLGNIAGEDLAQTVPSFNMNADSVRCVIVGNSFECNTPIQIVGDRHKFLCNVTRDGYTLESGATNCHTGFNYTTGSIEDTEIDNSGSVTNMMYSAPHTYTPTVTASGTAFDLGDGTISGRWQRHGRRVHLQIELLMGSTTTFGTGTYTFSLPSVIPAPGNGTSVGMCQMFDSSTGTHRVGVAVLPANSGVQCVADSDTNTVGASAPFSWADGDRLRIDVTYNL